jgi:hypothetical protein
MSNTHDEKELSKQKRGLLIKMIQRKFENHIYDHLNKTDFADMESLDSWLDKVLKVYFAECDAVTAYYDARE